MILSKYFPITPPLLLDIAARDARLILAARSWCIFRRAKQDALPRVRGYLLSGAVALRFALLMDVVQQIWPDPFQIHRPCCPTASVDELLLIRIINLACSDRRPEFDDLLKDMLHCEARDLFFAHANMLYQDTDA